MATPSQPTIGDRNANRSPEPATQRPSVVVMPGEVHHIGEAEDGHHGDDRELRAGPASRRRSRSASREVDPQHGDREQPAEQHDRARRVERTRTRTSAAEGGSPLAPTMSRPGHANPLPTFSARAEAGAARELEQELLDGVHELGEREDDDDDDVGRIGLELLARACPASGRAGARCARAPRRASPRRRSRGAAHRLAASPSSGSAGLPDLQEAHEERRWTPAPRGGRSARPRCSWSTRTA